MEWLVTGYLSVEYRPGLGQITMGVISSSLHHLFPDKIKLKHVSKAVLRKVKTRNKGERESLEEGGGTERYG